MGHKQNYGLVTMERVSEREIRIHSGIELIHKKDKETYKYPSDIKPVDSKGNENESYPFAQKLWFAVDGLSEIEVSHYEVYILVAEKFHIGNVIELIMRRVQEYAGKKQIIKKRLNEALQLSYPAKKIKSN